MFNSLLPMVLIVVASVGFLATCQLFVVAERKWLKMKAAKRPIAMRYAFWTVSAAAIGVTAALTAAAMTVACTLTVAVMFVR